MKLGFFPGCSAEGTALEYGQSVRVCADLLDIDLIELEDWNCCGASSGHTTDADLALALPARNIAIAEKMALPITVCCAACYLRLKITEHELRKNPARRVEISDLLEMPLEIKNDTKHFLEILYHQFGLEEIQKRVVRPLKELKIACYYGCYLVRPAEITHFDNPENPSMLDEFVCALGATPVDFPAKVDCCSGSLAFTRVNVGIQMIHAIHQSAIDAGANCIVVACPLCQANLDTRAPKNGLPIFYFSELLAVAMGHNDTKAWWKRHLVNPGKLIR